MASQSFDQDTQDTQDAPLPRGDQATCLPVRPAHLAWVDAMPLWPADHLPALRIDAAISFGRFRLLPGRRQLLIEGQPVALGSRAFDVLLALVLQRQRVVSRRN